MPLSSSRASKPKPEEEQDEWSRVTRGYPKGYSWEVYDKLVRLRVFDAPTPQTIRINIDFAKRLFHTAKQFRIAHPRKRVENILTRAIIQEILRSLPSGTGTRPKNIVDLTLVVYGEVERELFQNTRTSPKQTFGQWLEEKAPTSKPAGPVVGTFCSFCGARISPQGSFCPKCGAKQPQV